MPRNPNDVWTPVTPLQYILEPAVEVKDFKSLLLQKKSRRQIASVSDPAVNQHFAVLVQFSDPEPQITDWDVYRTYHVPLFVLLRGTNIDDLKITHLHIL